LPKRNYAILVGWVILLNLVHTGISSV